MCCPVNKSCKMNEDQGHYMWLVAPGTCSWDICASEPSEYRAITAFQTTIFLSSNANDKSQIPLILGHMLSLFSIWINPVPTPLLQDKGLGLTLNVLYIETDSSNGLDWERASHHPAPQQISKSLKALHWATHTTPHHPPHTPPQHTTHPTPHHITPGNTQYSPLPLR